MKSPIEIAPEDFIFYHDEMMLVNVEETASGRMATFQIPDESDICQFQNAMQRNKGPGTRFYATFIEVNDHDEPINQRKRKNVEQDKPPSPIKNVVTDAAMKCRSRNFQRWVYLQLNNMPQAIWDEFLHKTKIPYDIAQGGIKAMIQSEKVGTEWAKYYIYWVCKVRSRRDIGTKRGAANRYYQGIIIPFDKWANNQ